MKIQMSSLKTYYINLDSDIDKRKRMEDMLSEVNMNNVQRESGQIPKDEYFNCGPYCIKNAIGCGQCHESIYEKNDIFPFLVLEDDATLIKENFKEELNIPDECDCVYLGVSQVGLSTVKPGLYNIEEYDDNFFRIRGLYSAHAILYLNKTYMIKHLKAIKECLKTGWPFDVGFAKCQYDAIVLTPKKIWFYQQCYNYNSLEEKEGAEILTKFEIKPFRK